jgi:hypothetical protein
LKKRKEKTADTLELHYKLHTYNNTTPEKGNFVSRTSDIGLTGSQNDKKSQTWKKVELAFFTFFLLLTFLCSFLFTFGLRAIG